MNHESTSVTPKIFIALTLYLTSLFAANTLGIKLMPFVWGTHLSVAVFSFPIVFIMTDIIGEVYGKKMARLFVLAGFLSMILFLVYGILSAITPWSQSSLWVKDGYDQIFGISMRFTIASIIAYAVGEYQDIFAFFMIRNATGKKFFWLRSNISNLWSQLVDSSLFMFIAYLGIYPIRTIIAIILPWWLYKVAMGACYTPLSYVGIYLLRDRDVGKS